MSNSCHKKILVRAPNWIGDQILAYPFFHYLRQIYPSAHIAVACLPWVEAVQFRNLVDQVYELPRPEDSSFSAKWNALEKGAQILKQAGPWDLGICLPNSFSSAWLLFRAGVKRRRGYSADGRRLLLHEAMSWKKGRICHRSEAYLKLLRLDELSQLGLSKLPPIMEFWGILPNNELDPRIPGVVDDFDEKAWLEIKAKNQAIEPPTGRFWILAPGTTAESRRWPLDRFMTLAKCVADETGWPGLVIGGKAESEIAKQLLEDPSLKLQDWTARGPVASYEPVFRKAQFTVCNDSGLAHVAALCGSPVQIVWGAGNPKRTEPLGPGKVRIALNPVECWPCESNQCSQPPGRKLECLKGIDAEAVWKEIKTGIGIRL